MPIIPSIAMTAISQESFGKMAFDVMHHVFAIHDEYGRFFDEIIYKRELSRRMAGLEIEVGVEVVHQTFRKSYFADVIASNSGLFEFKAAEAIHSRHRAQITHYLLLFGLHHGKVINMRPESVEHEFVNVRANLTDLRSPGVKEVSYLPTSPDARDLQAHRFSSQWFRPRQFQNPRPASASPHSVTIHPVDQHPPNRGHIQHDPK